jgi:hypothetical protein
LACALTRDGTGRFDFIGAAGATVTVRVTGTAGAVGISAATVNDARVAISGTDTVQFPLAQGLNVLMLVLAVSVNGDVVHLVEDCGAAMQTLDIIRNSGVTVTGFSVNCP